MSAIQATFVRLQTMADGTPRIILEVQCSLSEIAALNLIPGAPFGLVRMTSGVHIEEKEPEAEKPKGGPLAKLAGMWCEDERFREWIVLNFPAAGDESPEAAAEFIRHFCGISSRSELDSNELAAFDFNTEIREPYMKYLRENNYRC